MDSVYRLLAESKIGNDKKLEWNNISLTSEYIQNYILKQFIDLELSAENVIVSLGDQCVDPHEYGHGFIYAGTSIVVDIYPKSRINFYYSDMTRTFCKGRAGDDLKKLYNTVYEAQRFALDKVHARQDGKSIHNFVKTYFEDKGYKTGIIDNVLQGFFHGIGHGLGIDCHELPSISINGTILQENNIVTVEPGLYYRGIGGVRIEDLVLVTSNGYDNLTNYRKELEIE